MNPSDQARQVGIVDSWLWQTHNAGGATNPGAGAVISDVGPLAAGYYDVEAIITFINTATLDKILLEHRNAADDATLLYGPILIKVGESGTVVIHWRNFKVLSSERFRVIVESGYTGYVAAAIRAVRRA